MTDTQNKALKPFNLERALAGDPVVNSAGTKAHKVLHLPEITPVFNGQTVLVIYSNGSCSWYTENTHLLHMAPKKKTVYVNFYEGASGNDAFWYEDEESAKATASNHAVSVAVPVELEI